MPWKKKLKSYRGKNDHYSFRNKLKKEKKVAKRQSMAVPEVVTEMVRARNDQGHYIADDPSTPENESWVEKPKKKAAPKKKTPAKKKAASKS